MAQIVIPLELPSGWCLSQGETYPVESVQPLAQRSQSVGLINLIHIA
ncbi:MAG: hypothetical protein KBT33_07305 [Prevotellaceae bacterium]|nr:hypothetical protein [Candidatus Minthosoma equi]